MINKLREDVLSCGSKMRDRDVMLGQPLFVAVFISSVFINKYVLSVLNFTYPTIFQGWQTLVGVVVLKIFVCFSNGKAWQVSVLDRKSFFTLLPHLICYVSALVAGSKALSKLPVSVFVCVGGLPGSSLFLLDQLQEDNPASRIHLLSAVVAFLTSVLVLLLDEQLEESVFESSNSPYYWMLVHIVCVTAQHLYARISDQKHSNLDKLYYGNLFSVVILAPASVYLEEAFQALHFEYSRQTLFHASCLLSGLLATAVGLLQCRTGSNQANQDLSRGRALAGLLSFVVPVFSVPKSLLVQGLIVVNLALAFLLPLKIVESNLSRQSSFNNLPKSLMLV